MGRPLCYCDLFSKFSQIQWCHCSGRRWKAKQSLLFFKIYIVPLWPIQKTLILIPSNTFQNITLSCKHYSYYSSGCVFLVSCLCNKMFKYMYMGHVSYMSNLRQGLLFMSVQGQKRANTEAADEQKFDESKSQTLWYRNYNSRWYKYNGDR